jgi:plasmid stabilization system protein ParE
VGQTRSVKLRYTLPAIADLTAILDYLATRSPQGARRIQPIWLRNAATVSGIRVDRDSSYTFHPIGYDVRARSRPLRAAAWSTRTALIRL